jgi:hypothetical protein
MYEWSMTLGIAARMGRFVAPLINCVAIKCEKMENKLSLNLAKLTTNIHERVIVQRKKKTIGPRLHVRRSPQINHF